MKVGMTTARATIQGLIAGRLIAGGARATVLMTHAPSPRWRLGLVSGGAKPEAPARGNHTCPRRQRRALFGSRFWLRGALRERGKRLQHGPGVRPRGRFLVVHVGRDRQADEQG